MTSNKMSAVMPSSIGLQSPSMNDLAGSFEAFQDGTATEVRLDTLSNGKAHDLLEFHVPKLV